MKKFILLCAIVFLTTGCGEESYDYECKKVDTSEAYKKTEIIKLGIDDKKVFKLNSTIKEEHIA